VLTSRVKTELVGIMREKWMVDIIKRALELFDGAAMTGVGAVFKHAAKSGIDWFVSTTAVETAIYH
jgi:uncharacterized membrane protein